MLHKRHLFAVVADLHLTSDAVRVVLHVASKGDGPHQVKQSELRALLNNCGERFLRSTIKNAQDAGWLKYKKGGGGQENSYWFDPSPYAQSGRFIDPAQTARSDRPPDPAFGAQSGNGSDPAESAQSANTAQGRTDVAKSAGSESDAAFYAASEGGRARDLPEHRIGVVEGDGELAPNAAEIFFDKDEFFVGCRGSLKDYLVRHVHPDRQYSYLQTVIMWLEGGEPVFRWPTGEAIEPEDHTRLLASAFNQLAADGETEMKGPPGSIRNLRTKLDIVIRKEWETVHEPHTNGSTRARGSRERVRSDHGSGNLDHLG